jgi:(p)ppGpp synthase/HD superfamily hydrolase
MISLVDQAIGFAAKAHDGQRRKSGSVPYIAHPVGVAMLLQRMGCDETIVAAGLLHDIVEDTTVTLKEVHQRFGGDVADIVAVCTEPPKKTADWESRKVHMINALTDAPLQAKLVAAADKYHNLSHTQHTKQKEGDEVWKRFGRGKRQQAWYYRTVFESIVANIPHPEQYPIFEQLDLIIKDLFAGIASLPPE